MQTLATLNTHCAEMMGILDAKQIKPSGEFIKKVRSPTLKDIKARNNVTVKENSGKKRHIHCDNFIASRWAFFNQKDF